MYHICLLNKKMFSIEITGTGNNRIRIEKYDKYIFFNYSVAFSKIKVAKETFVSG